MAQQMTSPSIHRKSLSILLARATFAPLAVSLLWLVQLDFAVSEVDSPRSHFFGSPLPWNAPSLSASMASDVFLGPLVIDVAVYAAIVWVLVRVARRWGLLRGGPVGVVAAGVVWAAGLFSAAMIGLVFFFADGFHLWYNPWGAITVTGVTLAGVL